MFTIQLNNLKFFSFHGLHEEERVLGKEYEINVAVTFTETGAITTLGQTIDYVKVYSIIKQRMNIPTALLETVAQDLAQLIYTADKRITSISISIKKMHPPIIAFTGNVGVNYKKDF
ncbi:MAG: dihydroneopterin aldolase [Bacteroidota bacterium]|jgi:dihydroneopterin aldolase